MAIITNTTTDITPIATRWSTPVTGLQIQSAIPLGLLIFHGTVAIATKIAGNETNMQLTVTMPDGFGYLLRNSMIRIASDDLINEFELIGLGQYNRALPPTFESLFNMISPGNISNQAAKATKLYTPAPLTPKLVLRPGDGITFRIADMDANETTAGDMTWFHQFYVFALDQIDKWQVNAPQPVISHTSF